MGIFFLNHWFYFNAYTMVMIGCYGINVKVFLGRKENILWNNEML